MKKIFLSLSLIFSFIAYAGYRHSSESLIKNSETSSSQTVPPTMPVKTDSLPSEAKASDAQKNDLKPEPVIRSDDENYSYENEDGGDNEGETGNARKVQTVSSQTSPSQTIARQTPTQSMKMMNTDGNMMARAQYKEGQYTGNIADAYYGNVQVKAVISGGKITDVQFLDYPNDRQNSIRINTYAMPILKSEAIKAQSAKVDVVSGATETSGAFQESLASALAQAKN